jgi:ATP-dependent protease ClpP protease subunit
MTQLLKLLTANRQIRPKAQSRIEAAADETAIYLYDTIVSDDLSAEYFGGVSAQSIVPQIRAIKGGTIRLHINSAGGDVFAGQAIAQAVRDTGAKVIVQIDGLAASAATLPAMAADQVEIAEGGFMMIHNAWTVAIGNANDLIETAALLEKVDGSIAAAYSSRSKLKMEDVRQMMNAETWFTAQEALDAGLVDGISKTKAARAQWDLSAYAHAPKEAIEASADDEADIDEHRERQQQRLRLLTRLGIS